MPTIGSDAPGSAPRRAGHDAGRDGGAARRGDGCPDARRGAPRARCGGRETARGPGLRILVAEDDTIVRLDLARLLVEAGHAVVGAARDGREAVDLARLERPELVLLDVEMPGLDGIAAAREITARRPVPVVLLTGHAHADVVRRAAGAGVFAYVLKPYRPHELLGAIAVAGARFADLDALRAEADALLGALDRTRVVERAQALVARGAGVGPDDALARLEEVSRRTGRPLAAVAEAVLEAVDDG